MESFKHLRRVKDDVPLRNTPIERIDKPVEMQVEHKSMSEKLNTMARTERWVEIEQSLGMSLDWLSDGERFYFLTVHESASEEKRKKMYEFANTFSLSGIRAFVATEYDSTMSDRLLALGEAHPEDAEGIFQSYMVSVERCDDIIRDLTERSDWPEAGLSKEDTRRLSVQLVEAIERKSAELLKVACMISEETLNEYDLPDVQTALNSLGFIADITYRFSQRDSRESDFYTFKEMDVLSGQQPKHLVRSFSGKEFILKFFVRPRGNAEGQARINIEIDFDTANPYEDFKDAFTQTTLRYKDQKTESESVLRVAIDRDTHDPQSSRLSLDIGRAAYDGKTMKRSGDMLGNMLRAVSESGNHTPYSFDPRFAESDTFENIATLFKKALKLKEV